MTDNTVKKIALVTGANKGIGLEIARQLARLGYTVLVGARDAHRGQTAMLQLQSEGLDAHFLLLNVTNQESIDVATQTVEQQFGWRLCLPMVRREASFLRMISYHGDLL